MAEDVFSVLETLEAEEVLGYFGGHWRDLAACRGIPTNEFFPTKEKEQRKLHRICEECVVQPECLDYALIANEYHGYWGDRSERARRKLRKELRQTRPDLIKSGRETAGRARKNMKGKLSKSLSSLSEAVEPIDEGELMQRLLPKVRQLLQHLALHGGASNTGQLMLDINISPEAFQQRLSLARQKKWVSLEGNNLKLTNMGRRQLV